MCIHESRRSNEVYNECDPGLREDLRIQSRKVPIPMVVRPVIPPADVDELEEIWEWIESFDAVVEKGKPGLASRILQEIRDRALASGVQVPFTANTPYVNTIHVSQQATLPGDQEIERKIKSLVRWNALAMVVRANREEHNIGGHISTYGSVATLFEVGFDYFFRARTE